MGAFQTFDGGGLVNCGGIIFSEILYRMRTFSFAENLLLLFPLDLPSAAKMGNKMDFK